MSSLTLIVQFVRNLFCVLKHDLFVGTGNAGHPLASFMRPVEFFGWSFPIDKMSMIDWIIFSTQLMAVVFCLRSSWRNISGGLSDSSNVLAWKVALKKKFVCKTPSPEQKILENGLTASGWKAIRSVLSGVCDTIFATSFFFSMINTTGYFQQLGNHDAFMNALTAMECALTYHIFMMFADLLRAYRNYHSLCAIANEEALYNEPEKYGVSSSLFKVLNFKPSWEDRKPPSMLDNDVDNLRTTLSAGNKKLKPIRPLLTELTRTRINLPIQLLVLLLNVVAGYGYMLSILSYKCKSDSGWSNLTEKLHFGLNTNMSYGDLAGDMAWTIEPLILLAAKPAIDSYGYYRAYDVRGATGAILKEKTA